MMRGNPWRYRIDRFSRIQLRIVGADKSVRSSLLAKLMSGRSCARSLHPAASARYVVADSAVKRSCSSACSSACLISRVPFLVSVCFRDDGVRTVGTHVTCKYESQAVSVVTGSSGMPRLESYAAFLTIFAFICSSPVALYMEIMEATFCTSCSHMAPCLKYVLRSSARCLWLLSMRSGGYSFWRL